MMDDEFVAFLSIELNGSCLVLFFVGPLSFAVGFAMNPSRGCGLCDDGTFFYLPVGFGGERIFGNLWVGGVGVVGDFEGFGV